MSCIGLLEQIGWNVPKESKPKGRGGREEIERRLGAK